MAKRFEFSVFHYSLQNTHAHILAEAESSHSVDLGMRSLNTRFAKAIRKISSGTGPVFAGRYHSHVLKTPSEAKRALRYVLVNYAKHSDLIEHVDDYSSGYAFKDWPTLLGNQMNGLLEDQLSGCNPAGFTELSPPRSWLAREGWKRGA